MLWRVYSRHTVHRGEVARGPFEYDVRFVKKAESVSFALKIRRAETPLYANLKRLAKAVQTFQIPGLRIVVPLLRAIAALNNLVVTAGRRMVVIFYRAPLFRSYCVTVGRNLYLEQLPSVTSHTRIWVGDDVHVSGTLVIASSHVFDAPELTIGNRVFLGHQVTIHASKRVVIEDGVLIAQGCYIADSDDHPRDRDLRLSGYPCSAEEIRPVRIGRGAWLGRSCYVLKGVTVGEGAIIGACSVVVSDVPPFCIAVGNPARVVQKL